MKLLKFFLYLVLMICLAWGSLIFAGPSLISYLISSYSNNQVRAFDISVSPKLGVKIKRLDFDFSRELHEFNGSARSIGLTWSFRRGSPEVIVSVGPTLFDNGAGFKFANISLENLNLIAPTDPAFAVEVEDSFFKKKLSIQTLSLQSSIKNNFTTLDRLTFEFSGLEFQHDTNYYLSKLNGEIDTIKIFERLQSQSQKILVKFNGAEDQQKNIIIPNNELFLIHDYGVLRADISAKKILLVNSEFMIDDLNLLLVYNLEKQEVTEPIKFTASNLVHDKYKLNLIDFEIVFRELGNLGEFVATIDATLDEIELTNGDMYLGSIPKGHLRGSAELRTNQGNLNTFFTTDLQLHAKGGPDLNVRTALKFFADKSLINCLINYCEIKRLENQSQLKIGDAILHLTEVCPNDFCPKMVKNYTLETVDTKSFFESLTKSKILNPLVAAALYSQTLSGQVSGSGHILNFKDLSF